MQDKSERLLVLDLQFFAKDGPGGEKTEPATQKKLNDARKEGQVCKSKERDQAATLVVLFLLLRVFMSFLGQNFLQVFKAQEGKLQNEDIFHNSESCSENRHLNLDLLGVPTVAQW